MTLGPDNAICKAEFVEAMRPIAGSNVDLPQVNPNFGALGLAVFRICTVLAETASDQTHDATYWQWVSAVNAWLNALSTWQNGVRNAFAGWTTATSAEAALKTAILAVPVPGNPPATPPTQLRGRIK